MIVLTRFGDMICVMCSAIGRNGPGTSNGADIAHHHIYTHPLVRCKPFTPDPPANTGHSETEATLASRRLESLEERISAMDAKFEKLQAQFSQLEAQLNCHWGKVQEALQRVLVIAAASDSVGAASGVI